MLSNVTHIANRTGLGISVQLKLQNQHVFPKNTMNKTINTRLSHSLLYSKWPKNHFSVSYFHSLLHNMKIVGQSMYQHSTNCTVNFTLPSKCEVNYASIKPKHWHDWAAISRQSCGLWLGRSPAACDARWRCVASRRGFRRRRRRQASSGGTEACKSDGRNLANERCEPFHLSRHASPWWTAPSICSRLRTEKWNSRDCLFIYLMRLMEMRKGRVGGSTDGEGFSGEGFDGDAAADGGE